jgi:hypothetical protein
LEDVMSKSTLTRRALVASTAAMPAGLSLEIDICESVPVGVANDVAASVSSTVQGGGKRRAGGIGVENSVQKQVMDQGERRACHAVESSA